MPSDCRPLFPFASGIALLRTDSAISKERIHASPLEGGLGIGFYTRSTPAVYRGFTNANGREIEQDLKLRIVPFTATVRVVPFGRESAFQLGGFNYLFTVNVRF